MVQDVIPSKKSVEIIHRKKFAAAVLEVEKEAFVVHITTLKV